MAATLDSQSTAPPPAPGSTIMADGTPISASPARDAERGVLVVHSDRDAGSNYDDVPVDPKAAKRARRRARAAAGDGADLQTDLAALDELT